MNNINDTLIPAIGVITDVRIDTPDIKTFRVVTSGSCSKNNFLSPLLIIKRYT